MPWVDEKMILHHTKTLQKAERGLREGFKKEIVEFSTNDRTPPTHPLRGNLIKKSIFKDIIQIEGDPSPSHPIFGKVLIMLTSLPTLEFLTKIMTF